MRRSRIALIFSFCLIFMTACADAQVKDDSAPVMNEADTREQASESAAILEDAQDVTSHTKEESGKEESEKGTGEKKETAESEKESLPETTAAKLSENLYDFQLSINGIVYQFPMSYADFEAMGWTYDGESADILAVNQYVALQRWMKDDIYVHTKLANLSEAAVPYSDSIVAGINIERSMIADCDWKILLPGGIEWGVSNADDIREAYGEPVSDYDGERYYKMTYQDDYYREIDLYVYKDTNALEQIDMENLRVLNDNADNAEGEKKF